MMFPRCFPLTSRAVLCMALIAGTLAAPLTTVAQPGDAAKPAPTAEEKKAAAAKARAELKVRKKAAIIVRKVISAPPGTDRYRLVDQLIDLGDAAWPVVDGAIAKFIALKEGESVAVDLLLGFMDLSYSAVERHVAGFSPPAARRVVKFVLRLDADKRQLGVLRKLVPSKDADVLLMVLPALLQHERGMVMARLVEIVDDKRESLSSWAIDTIATHRHAPALPTLVRLMGIEKRRATARNFDRRRKLIHAISRIGGEAAVPPLLEALSIPDQRPSVYEGMRIVGQPAVLAALFMLRTATGPRIAIAMNMLAHMRHEAAPHLVTLLSRGDRNTRDLALDVLTRIATPDVRPQLLKMVREKKFADVRDGVRLLVTLYNADVRSLMFGLLEHKNPEIRRFIVEQFWRLRDPKTFRVLRVVAAQDSDRQVRIDAVRAVAGVGDPAGPELLERMVADTDSLVRLEVVEQLSRVGNWRTAVNAMATLLADPNDEIFRATLAALQRMTFSRKRRRAASWRGWVAAEKARKPAAFEGLTPDEVAFSAGKWRFAAQQAGTDGPTILVVSGPPFRDATHMAPYIWQLRGAARVVVMRRAPGTFRSATMTQRIWSRELDAMARAVGARRYTVLADAAGAAYALRHAAARKSVQSVVIEGGWLPSRAALRALPEQLKKTMGPLGLADWTWAQQAQWQLHPGVRRRIALRGVWRGLLGATAMGIRLPLDGVLASDALTDAVRHRVAGIVDGVRLRRVKQRVLLLMGSKAPWAKTTEEAVKTLGKRSKVQVKTIVGAGALPLFERGSASVDAIGEFVQR
ncbi:MAG: HEAT repeat domain-containing protein [Myxococcales bacterium]|nr:HEAT repeat domain-containing protein [Myxococcales bacterium]